MQIVSNIFLQLEIISQEPIIKIDRNNLVWLANKASKPLLVNLIPAGHSHTSSFVFN